MNYQISNSTFAPIVQINLSQGEKVKIERGSMVYKNGAVAIEGGLNGQGLLKSIGRAMTSGESMFITTATSNSNNGVIGVAPATPGEIIALQCGEQQWFLNDGAYLASSEEISYEMNRKSGVGTALLGGSGGFFNMKTSGVGTVLVNAFGSIIEYNLNNSDEFYVDNSHVVAWSSDLNYSMEVASGTFGFTTGEGVIIKFSGTGKLYIQTRHLAALAGEIKKYLPNK